MMFEISESESLWDIATLLSSKKHVDLTHTFEPDIPHAVDVPIEESKKLYDFEKDGFQTHQYSLVGQWGTHCDPPIHFIEGGRTSAEKNLGLKALVSRLIRRSEFKLYLVTFIT